MSGGVDSSAAAALLKDDGYEVVGVFMRNGAVEEQQAEACATGHALPQLRKHKQGCCSVDDAHDARLVAATLGIPFYVLNFEKDFGRIKDYFVAEYNAGRTPNPCVRCNDWLKFGKLHDYARSIDAEFVATGHYARVGHRVSGIGSRGSGRSGRADTRPPTPDTRLLRGIDHAKDQSYVLFGTPRQQLDHMLLPIGHLEKHVTRQIAEDNGLPTFNKPDSQEICFVPDNNYAGMVERHTDGGFAPGDILDTDGNILGQHPGHQHYTHGQRRGLGVALGKPAYVVDKDPGRNTITVGAKDDLLATRCTASQANWLTDPPAPGEWTDCLVKVRYNSQPTPGRVQIPPEAGGQGTGIRDQQSEPGLPAPQPTTNDLPPTPSLHIHFTQPLEAVTPGQAVVCYGLPGTDLADTVLCGGWIDHAMH